MRGRGWPLRTMLLPAVVVAGLGVCPAGAWAAITIDAVRLHHVTNPPFSPSSPAVNHVSSPPGGVMHARADVTITGGSTWRATRVVWTPIGGGDDIVDCADHAENRTSSTEPQFGFTLHPPFARAALENTARGPSASRFEGDYSVSFFPSTSDNCASGTVNLQGGVTNVGTVSVTPPDRNENLSERCGIDVMLVLDESGSIDRFGATQAVKDATEGFLDALVGTGSRVAITEFNGSARWEVEYNTVTAATLAPGGVFRNYINSFSPSGWTNWEDAFSTVRDANRDGIVADLVVFVTDGDPTARNRAPGEPGATPQTGLIDGSVLALQPAWREANLLKSEGSHIFAVGVGPAVQIETSRRRLAAVTGYNEYPGVDFSRADYTVEPDFEELERALRRIVLELCQSTVIVTKEVDQGDGHFEVDPGWVFRGSVEPSEGGFEWLQPPPRRPGVNPATDTTDEDGVATFQWETGNANATSTFNLEEAGRDGYDSVGPPQCAIVQAARRRGRIRRQVDTEPLLTLGPGQFATCTVQNRIRPGTIEIEKNATPESSQVFSFTGSLGDFTLVDDRTNQASSRTFTNLAPGTYTVSELVPDNWQLIGITCDPDAAAVIVEAQATITLAPGGAAVCTFYDVRIDPPPVDPPVVPPVDPDPPQDTPTPPTPPEPPTLPPSTQLRVVKTLPRVARVGQRIRFRLTVRNTGSIAARGVTRVDAPPAPVALAGLTASRRARIVRRTAVWRLGTLAPGARRTIRGTVRVQAAPPGRLRNVVLAGAANARVVTGQADTRIRARRARRVPPVTG